MDELLRLKDGQRCLGAMIDNLPQHLNWQTAFLQAFAPHFDRLLDVEKWWELACVHFTDIDFAARFSPRDSWRRLQQALDVPVEVRFSPDRLPAQAEITLQEVIHTWEPARAEAALQRVAGKLSLLRLQITPELRPLLDLYLSTVQNYLGDTHSGAAALTVKNFQPPLAGARDAACRKLNALDAQRAALRPQYVSQPVQTQPSPGERARLDCLAPISPSIHSHEKIHRPIIGFDLNPGRRRLRAGRRHSRHLLDRYGRGRRHPDRHAGRGIGSY